MNDRIKDLIERIPVSALLFAYLAWLGYDLYTFLNDSGSDLMRKQGEIEAVQRDNESLHRKIVEANLFYKSLDQKRMDLRALASHLDELKATLSDELDIPSFVKTVTTEASRVGLTVVGIKPEEPKKLEYYIEQPFQLLYKGVFVQLMVFLDRLSSVERIVRVDNFEMHRVGSSLAPYVELNGVIHVKTYRYLGSKADEVGRATAAKAAADSPVKAPPPGSTGAPGFGDGP